MKHFFLVLIFALVLPTQSYAQAPGEVSCDNGVDIDKVQALVKKTVAALAKDQAAVLRQINQGDRAWKDGDFYVVVLQGTKILAHGYVPAMVGQDMATLPYYGELATAVEHMMAQKSEGCVRYKAPKPSQRGQLEDKVSYVVKLNGTMRVLVGTYLIRK
jgi:signal transduction histidine kinase